MNILVAISSIGLGHVARTRCLIEEIRRRKQSTKIEVIAPPPIHKYLEAWNIPVHPISLELEPITPIVDQYYEKTGKGLISLKMALEEHEIALRNSEKLDEHIDYDSYDVILMDESWELLESKKIYQSTTRKIYLTDFINYPYKIGYILSAFAVNRFLKKRLEKFHKTLYIGIHEKLPDTRWFLLYGEKISKWAEKHVEIIGPIPPILENEILPKDEARRTIGVSDLEKKIILFSMGGTKAGYRLIPKIVKAVEKIGLTLAIASGASYNYYNKNNNTIILDQSTRYKLPKLVRAFDAIITFSGLSSITLSAVTGIPTIVFPLPKHFEQEENAEIASKKWSWIKKGSFNHDITKILEVIKQALKTEKNDKADRMLFLNLHRIIDFLSI